MMNLNENCTPFLKWAGGKTQLLNDIESRLPPNILDSKYIDKYFEPFVGGGAVFFYLLSNYKVKESYISDLNEELILTYNVIKNDCKKLIEILYDIKEEYLSKDNDFRKEYYLEIRKTFNKSKSTFDFNNYSFAHIQRASFLIFMNKTCFNGLFRVNKKGKFNVPHGRYKNPSFFDEDNLKSVSKILKRTNISCGDFSIQEDKIDSKSFVYLDPPYRPISKTSFREYGANKFEDNDQIRLYKFFERMDKKGANLLLSNSDPKNSSLNDCFFDDLYKKYNIDRVKAKRFINRDASNRGAINELLIYNYNVNI